MKPSLADPTVAATAGGAPSPQRPAVAATARCKRRGCPRPSIGPHGWCEWCLEKQLDERHEMPEDTE